MWKVLNGREDGGENAENVGTELSSRGVDKDNSERYYGGGYEVENAYCEHGEGDAKGRVCGWGAGGRDGGCAREERDEKEESKLRTRLMICLRVEILIVLFPAPVSALSLWDNVVRTPCRST